MAITTGTGRIVFPTTVLVIAGAVLAMMMLAASPTSSAMPASSPSPTMSSDMPGMDHGSANTPTSSPSPTSSGDSPWNTHDHSSTAGHDHGITPQVLPGRPLVPVMGAFGGATSAVLLSAGFLRRKDRARSRTKEASRVARRIRT